MKKIGIMSMQRIYNYGSFLQGYALKRLIESIDSANKVSFIDYNPGEPLIKGENIESTGIKRKIEKIKEYYNVDTSLKNKIRFFNHKRTYAKRFFPILGITDEKINSDGLDTLVIGSDEVFNCVQSNTNVGYSRDLFGHNAKSKNIISYAGSFGNTTLNKLQQYGIDDQLKEDFSKFSAISVRDQNSYKIVTELGVEASSINVDPVLAYDYMKLEDKIPKTRLYKKKYMIVYGYSGRLSHEENNILCQYAMENNLKILCFGGVQGCCDEFIDCDPFELLAYFRDAEAIVTDTFHGTIFSIINQKKFITIIRKSNDNNYGNEEKITYLLDLFNLSTHYSSTVTKETLNTIINNIIDWAYVEKVLFEERNKTKNYLLSSLNRGGI